MKISLKEARRIELRIYERVLSNPLMVTGMISIYADRPTEELVEEITNKTEENILNRVKLLSVRSSIRRAIQESNEISGINKLISQQDYYNKHISLWNAILHKSEYLSSIAEIKGSIEAELQSIKVGKSLQSFGFDKKHVVEFVAISPPFKERAEKEIKVATKELDKISDTLSSLNATTSIEIDDSIVGILEENNII